MDGHGDRSGPRIDSGDRGSRIGNVLHCVIIGSVILKLFIYQGHSTKEVEDHCSTA